jgi:flagellin
MGSSLLTNSAAMTALQTLSATNKKLDMTQNRISTGLRVATATDNAAYWSIATTMKSDNKALSAVQDALGLGAATLDMMYTGLNSSVEVVTEIKAKLTAARQPGVDRAKIQDEITSLQKQLRGSADATVFNGENWISVDSEAAGYNDVKSVVSSFSRTGGVVTIDTVNVDAKSIKLFDKTSDATYIGAVTPATAGTLTFAASTVGDPAAVPPTTTGTISVQVGAGTAQVIDVSTSTTIGDLAKKFRALNIEGLTVGIDVTGGVEKLVFASRNDQAITITNGAGSADGGATAITSPAAVAAAATNETAKGVLDKTYDVYREVNGANAWTKFSIAGENDGLDISKLTDSAMDIAALETYIAAVDQALGDITTSASSLGAIKSRVGLQQDFVKSLTDSLDRGIGQLVDADMNAESTRLQALQTQQQLGIQALSIANGNSQSILSLFRG